MELLENKVMTHEAPLRPAGTTTTSDYTRSFFRRSESRFHSPATLCGLLNHIDVCRHFYHSNQYY